MPAVEVKGLKKYYGKKLAVKGIDFNIEKGEIFGLIGPNGAGKTTTLRVLATLLQINGGSVKIMDYDLESQPEKIRQLISYLPEDAGAYKNLTGRKYLNFIVDFFGKENKEEMITKGIEIADLADRIDSKVDSYSKGMQRRLLVGRALMIDPKLAILDEPTSGLDVINAQEIRNIIKNAAEANTTFLISSHNMLEVEYLCNRVALISKGKILEVGTPQELKKKYKAENVEEVFTKVVK